MYYIQKNFSAGNIDKNRMIIAITGGKGGTGKSTVATSLAVSLAEKENINKPVLLIDADVDCPNDHLLLSLERKKDHDVMQRIPEIKTESCTSCGKCASVCKTKALVSIKGKGPLFIPSQCNGCGACFIVCPKKAINFTKKKIGSVYTAKRENLYLLSGELNPNEAVSEFIVNDLNIWFRSRKNQFSHVIIDTAAGTHCPVLAALEDAEKVIAVTEPTPLGAHDVKIILDVLKRLNKKVKIILNRSDIGDKKIIYNLAHEYDTAILLEIPYSKDIIRDYSHGNPIQISEILGVIQ
jgi:MinD superfamily P-loop ATPase